MKFNVVKELIIGDNFIETDAIKIAFPMSLKEVSAVFGTYETRKSIANHTDWYTTYYIFHNYGLVFTTDDYSLYHLKKAKAYIDDEHAITRLDIYTTLQNKQDDENIPNACCNLNIYINRDGIGLTLLSECDFINSSTKNKIEIYPSYSTSVYNCSSGAYIDYAISYFPKRPESKESYKIKKTKEESLHFNSLNFKFAILQVLIYDLELLKPYFNLEDFAYQYSGKEIDLESYKPIKPVINFFQKLPIPKSYAEKVEEIYMDGGNDIYMNIIPQWDGEDEYFDINDIDEDDLAQFPNLKKINLMSSDFDKVSKILKENGIEVTR